MKEERVREVLTRMNGDLKRFFIQNTSRSQDEILKLVNEELHHLHAIEIIDYYDTIAVVPLESNYWMISFSFVINIQLFNFAYSVSWSSKELDFV